MRTHARTIFTALIALGCFSATASAQGAGDLTLNGTAKLVTGPHGAKTLSLTTAQIGQDGSAFTTTIIPFDSRYRFETFFQFAMTDPGGIGAADGIAFVLQTEGPNALGAAGGSLGYAGIKPSVGVEFDTFYNSGLDLNGNQVAILKNGNVAGIAAIAPYGETNCQPPTGVFGCMGNGDIWSVWIDYDGTNLNVAIADQSLTRPANLISYPINIPKLLGQNSAYAGFTSATGNGVENHEILFWHFSPAPADPKEE